MLNMHGSNPELSTGSVPDGMELEPLNITLRKRKKPEEDYDVKQQLDDFRKQMMSFLTSFSNKQNENMEKMRQDITTDIKEQIGVISSLSQNMLEEHNQLKAEVLEVKERISLFEETQAAVSSLPKSLNEANQTIQMLLKENNNAKQFSMMNNLEISGFTFSKGENLMSILHNICVKVGFTLQDGDVDMIHRVRRYQSTDSGTQKNTRPPAIIVRFTQRKRKDALLSLIRARRGITTADLELPGPASSVYVGDHLTPNNKLLLKRARQIKSELQYTYLWIRDCKIQMRKNDNSRVIYINDHADLDKLK